MNNDVLVAWLNDAYGVEQSAIEAQGCQIEPIADHPVLQVGIEQHPEETTQHAELNKQSLEELGESSSGVESGIAMDAEKLQGMSAMFAKDRAVKVAINNHAVGRIEMASYEALIKTVEHVGQRRSPSGALVTSRSRTGCRHGGAGRNPIRGTHRASTTTRARTDAFEASPMEVETQWLMASNCW